jgi:hypothetical protein
LAGQQGFRPVLNGEQGFDDCFGGAHHRARLGPLDCADADSVERVFDSCSITDYHLDFPSTEQQEQRIAGSRRDPITCSNQDDQGA